jgi:L-fuconolactonase
VKAEGAPVVDTHVHVRSPDEAHYPLAPTSIGSDWWASGDRSTQALLSELNGAGVAYAVLVQAVGPYGFDNSYILDSATLAPGRFACVAAVNLDDPAARDDIRRFSSHPDVVGVRFFGMTLERSWIGSPAATLAFDAAAQAGLTVVLTVPGDLLHQLRGPILAAQTPVVLDHCGFPQFDAGMIADNEEVWRFAEAEHVALKVTTHSFEQAHASCLGHDDARLISRLAETFGAERIMWGSDFPQTSSRSYSALVDRGRHAANQLSAADRDSFLGGTATRLFALGDLPEIPTYRLGSS